MAFTKELKDSILFVKCPEEFNELQSQLLEASIDDLAKTDALDIVLDFSDVLQLDLSSFKSVALLYRKLKSLKKNLHSLALKEKFKRQVVEKGLEGVFNFVKDDEPKFQRKKTKQLDVKFINTFVESTKIVMSQMLAVKINVSAPLVKKIMKSEMTKFSILALLNLQDARFQGTLALAFPKDTFLNLYNKLMGEKHSQIHEQIEDAAAEFLNIIFGKAKEKLNNELGYEIKMAIPKILSEKDIQNMDETKNASLIIPFQSQLGDFEIQILVN